MEQHEFIPGKVNPLTCGSCKEPKGVAVHSKITAKSAEPVVRTFLQPVTISFSIPGEAYADLAAKAKSIGSKSPSTLAKEFTLKALGYEWVPAQPKRVIPAQPARYQKKV